MIDNLFFQIFLHPPAPLKGGIQLRFSKVYLMVPFDIFLLEKYNNQLIKPATTCSGHLSEMHTHF